MKFILIKLFLIIDLFMEDYIIFYRKFVLFLFLICLSVGFVSAEEVSNDTLVNDYNITNPMTTDMNQITSEKNSV